MKTKLAKKYIVKTDQLFMFDLKEGDKIFLTIKNRYTSDHVNFIDENVIIRILCRNPDWLEEVQEKEFTKKDLICAVKYVSGAGSISIINIDKHMDSWLETRNNKEP